MRRILGRLARGLLYTIVIILVLAGLLLGGLETAWGKNLLRGLIVTEANQYLTATLQIGGLSGSILRGVELTDVRLTRDGEVIVGIDRVALSYSLRELLDSGTTIRRIQLVHPSVVAKRELNGQWNLAALVRRTARERERTGPGRAIRIDAIDVENGTVVLKDPLVFGAAHVPSRFERLNLALALTYVPVSWRVDITSASWLGGATELAVDRLAGSIASGSDGLSFNNLVIHTAQTGLTVNGRVVRSSQPTVLDLHVVAERFVFQEWASVLPALQRFPIDSAFDAQLTGPLAALLTNVTFRSNAGGATGALTLDTTVPGWHGKGAVALEHLDLAPWFNNPARKSDVTGRATFDVALELGRGLPQGTYAFVGSHAAYGGYQADQLDVRGTITDHDWHIAQGRAVAYGANVTLAQSTIRLADPVQFHFQGAANHVDLRLVPDTVPVPHVESTLAFRYDVGGQFVSPFIKGTASFDESTFLGANIASGAEGWIDTSEVPLHYSGHGDVSGINLHRFGADLEVPWLQDPRYAGTLAGQFDVDVRGSESATMNIVSKGRIAGATIFGGTLADGAYTLNVNAGTLEGSYQGQFDHINPAIPFDDPRWAASLSGRGAMRVVAPGLLVNTLTVADYDVTATADMGPSDIQNLHIDAGTIDAGLSHGVLNFNTLRVTGPLLEGSATGQLGLQDGAHSQIDYSVARGDLALLKDRLGDISGDLTTSGRLEGPWEALRLTGKATATNLRTPSVTALTASGDYDVTLSGDAPADATGTVTGSAAFVDIFGRTLESTAGTVTYDKSRVTADLKLVESTGLNGAIRTELVLRPDGHSLDLSSAVLTLGGLDWRLLPSTPAPVVSWTDTGVALSGATLVTGANSDQRIELGGTWQPAGGGTFRAKATNVFLDSLSTAIGEPATYGGILSLDATLTGSQEQPIVTGQIAIVDGRVRRLTYERLAGRVDYRNGDFDIDLRLDQSPNVWLTFVGTIPPTLFSTEAPDRPVNLTIVSSDISLGLLESLTSAVRDVTGRLRANLHVAGTTHEPLFSGPVEMSGVGFQVASTGARYKNGAVNLDLSRDLIDVKTFHLEDRNGSPLSISGALGTQELRMGEFHVDLVAKKFEVLRNELGTVQVDATLGLRGRLDAPRLFGDVTIAGGQINTDEILSQALYQPYATQAVAEPSSDAIAALNPWNALSLEVAVHSQNALRIIGDNLAVSNSSPLGMGSFDLRATGDIFLTKAPDRPLSVVGSLDSISGSYSFQGRRFDLYPSSSVDFLGDLNPSLFISVNRIISGVEARVTISGTLNSPELQLSSTPPLDPADVLSLIVFNASANELNSGQQRELAVRAGTLAVGFLTNSLTTALERSLGLDILEVEPVTGTSSGAKVTVGQEIAPGLVARFSRQFGNDQYDEATIEYYISRILRIRATFSDASQLNVRSPFRRVEPASLDFIFLFSF